MISTPLISFVLPIFNEEQTITKLWDELYDVYEQIKDDFDCEFIFINDGSKDNSMYKLKELYEKYPKIVKIINFTRNYGHQIAVTAGQDYTKGDAIIIMDTDLQDPPIVCLDLIKKWEEGFDIVYAQRRKYKTNFTKQISAFVFYRLLKKIASVDIAVDTGDFRLISKRVNEEMKKYKEKSRFLRGISCLTGFSQTAVLFDRSERFAGKPGYTFLKSFRLAMDGITGFSLVPLKLISITGIIFALSSFVLGTIYIAHTVITKTNVSGWASMMFVVIFMGGIQLLTLGIIGEYVGRIYAQVLDRPLYTVEEILQ